MTQFYAQPYDISSNGFYFCSKEDYDAKAAKARNDYGQRVEEFEIQFIDGEEIDCALAKAWGVNQSNLGAFFDAVDEWNLDQKIRVIIAVGESGFLIEEFEKYPDDAEIEYYEVDSLKELAEQFIDDGLFGNIPERLRFYISYDAIARDLAVDFSEIEIAGQRLIYRCG